MATSTYQTYLMLKGTSDFEKFIDIKEAPDLGGVPEMLETTTMSDGQQTFIEGIQSGEAMTFTTNYTPEDFQKVEALKGEEQDWSVWLGGTDAAVPDGHLGKFNFKGTVSAMLSGGGVNEVRNMTVTIAPSTPIEPIFI